MVRELEAIYEQGLLRPLEPLTLKENQVVRLTVDDKSADKPQAEREGVLLRKEEFEWLAKNGETYAGQWVALDGYTLLANGPNAVEVSERAYRAGAKRPLITHVELSHGTLFGGW
jgi:predicted DNA-binding antitoxin AbrB/MazE fold protein